MQCVTLVDAAQAPSGGNPVVATNSKGLLSANVSGTLALRQASSEVASILNQKSGNERLFRMDEGSDSVVTTQVKTISSSPNAASFYPSVLDGADGALHTEPVDANTGAPGKGDGQIPKTIGIPNYQAYGENVNEVGIQNGSAIITPVNHPGDKGLQASIEKIQKDIEKKK